MLASIKIEKLVNNTFGRLFTIGCSITAVLGRKILGCPAAMLAGPLFLNYRLL